MKLLLPNVTLIGIDCLDLKRLQLAADISTKDILFGAVKLLSSIKSDDSRVIQIPHIDSTKSYSNFMIKELNKYVDTEFALIFQYDGFVLNSSSWSDEFLKYDYIGSPWYHIGDLRVGNGGFSLRSKKLIDWLSLNWKIIGANIHPEDIFISKFARPYIEKNGMKFASEYIASLFAIEGNERSVVWKGEFGFHGIKYTDISNWFINHEEYKDKLNYKIDDYVELMKKYPIYDGTVFTFKFTKFEIDNYVKISRGEKKYEARPTQHDYNDLSNIKVGNTIIFKRRGVPLKVLPIPAFEKKVVKIEQFKSLKDLRVIYPKIHITLSSKNMPKWKIFLVRILGDFMYSKNKSYSVFWFD